MKLQAVIHQLEADVRLGLNWRYTEHATRDAAVELKAHKEQLKLNLLDTKDKIKDIEKNLGKQLGRQRSRHLTQQLEKLQKQATIIEKTLNGTLPTKTVFGGRKLFTARTEGKITIHEWREARNSQIYSIGQQNQQGNANIRIKDDQIGINLPEPTTQKVGKDGRVYRTKNQRKWLQLHVNEKYRLQMQELLQSGQAYSVRIMKKQDRYLVLVSFEVEAPHPTQIPKILCRDTASYSSPRSFYIDSTIPLLLSVDSGVHDSSVHQQQT